ncbi:AAA family ATPase [Maricaulis salignorans]|uniref:Pilus assembly protein CpaE n=1 Tax=Maricaulis salignorans TaxID=144026 RepID=A0A1G9NE03_9PROT|nr:AAA family ATPase [Maricaulis salignorans]SDL84692.1 pilus assembly protein CpaE [Maricaulis salignorans]
MADAKHALNRDVILDGDDPFLDASDIERLMLGEAAPAAAQAAPQTAPVDADRGSRRFGAGSAPEADEFLDTYHSEAPAPAPQPERSLDTEFAELQDEFMASQAAMPAGEALFGEIDREIADQPVPRISIAAFCERPETGALVHNAAGDRRLAKAHIAVELGGLPAAIERYHDATTPNLLIVESGMRGQGLFEQLEELASVCDPDTKVIIIGAANDIALYRELMKRGVSEYLVPPMTPLHLIRSISDLFLDPEQPFAGKTIAFIGAKGGVGSSTIAHNCAWSLSEGLQTDAVLVDLDLSFGTAGLDFNQDPAQTLGDALNEPDRLDDALLDRLLVRCTERLSLFSAPATLDRDWEFSPNEYEMVLDKVRRQAPFVALDLPHLWLPWVRDTLLSSDQVVVTVTPDLASLRNAKNLFDLIAGARPNDELPKVVINMAGMPKRPEIPVKDFADALGTPPALVLPFEPQLFGKAANNGQMIHELDPKSKAADGFAHLAGLVTGRTAGPMRKRSIVSKLFGG